MNQFTILVEREHNAVALLQFVVGHGCGITGKLLVGHSHFMILVKLNQHVHPTKLGVTIESHGPAIGGTGEYVDTVADCLTCAQRRVYHVVIVVAASIC